MSVSEYIILTTSVLYHHDSHPMVTINFSILETQHCIMVKISVRVIILHQRGFVFAGIC